MSVLYLLIPISFLMAFCAFLAFTWSVKSGQLDDLSGDSERLLFGKRVSDNNNEGGET